MEKEEKKLYFESFAYDLINVGYLKLNSDDYDDITLHIKDYYDYIDINNDSFEIFYTRYVGFEPQKMFDMKVTYQIKFVLDKKTKKEYANNFDELKALINSKTIKAIEMTGVISKASALISNITMQNNGNTLITPPNFINE